MHIILEHNQMEKGEGMTQVNGIGMGELGTKGAA